MRTHRNLHNGINFVVTRRCPLQCDHCVMESGPWYREHLTGDTMISWLSQARDFGITRASYTGGDPVLYLDDLAAAMRHARELGMVNSLFTSGFWATSEASGARVLERLEGIGALGLSTSTFHEQYVPLERVVHAIVAAASVGVDGVVVQIADFESSAEDLERRLRKLLPKSLQKVPMQRQSVFAAGRAATLTIPQQEQSPLEVLDMSCPAPALTVEPDGLMRGCCSSLLALKKKNPFIFGDLFKEKLEPVLERASSSHHYQIMRTRGLGPLVAALQEDGLGDSVPKQAVNACDLCFRLYSRPAVATHLEERFGGQTGESA